MNTNNDRSFFYVLYRKLHTHTHTMPELLVPVSVTLFFVMFIYSGIDKIIHFKLKSKRLSKKMNVGKTLANLGLSSVILLEVIASVVVIFYFWKKYFQKKKDSADKVFKNIVKILIWGFVVFVVAVTWLYHPPTTKKIIPFLSNVSTLAGCLLLVKHV